MDVQCIASLHSSTLMQPGSDQSHGHTTHAFQGGRSASNAPSNRAATDAPPSVHVTTSHNVTLGDVVATPVLSSVMNSRTATLDSWGKPRLVEILREEGENLGISIVGEHTPSIGDSLVVITFPSAVRKLTIHVFSQLCCTLHRSRNYGQVFIQKSYNFFFRENSHGMILAKSGENKAISVNILWGFLPRRGAPMIASILSRNLIHNDFVVASDVVIVFPC